MSDNVIESYLVRLGVQVDKPGFDQFQGALKSADSIVSKYTASWLENILKFQIVTTSAFASLGTAVIGLADHVASADQDYRLFGLHMYMSQSAARSTKIAMDALGESLDDIVWDPELHQRYTALIEMQSRLQGQMGPGFEKNMRSIRDLRFELTKLQVEATQYLLPEAVSSLFDKLGFGSGDLIARLEQLSQWFAANIPNMASEVADFLIPGWNDFLLVIRDVGSEFKMAAGDFTFLTGVLSGDKSLQTTEFNLRKVGEATNWWIDLLTKVLLVIGLVEKEILRLGTAMGAGLGSGAHLIASGYDLVTGNKEASKADKQEADRLNLKSRDEGASWLRDMKDEALAPTDSQDWLSNPDMSGFRDLKTNHNQSKNHELSRFLDAGDITTRSDIDYLFPSGASSHPVDAMNMIADRVGKDLSLSAGNQKNIFEQMMFETRGGTSRGTSFNNFAGIKGPDEQYQQFASIDDFIHRYEQVLTLPRYSGILNARNEQDFSSILARGKYYTSDNTGIAATQTQYAAGMQRYGDQYGDVTINVHVNQPNASAQEIATAVMQTIQTKSDRRNQLGAATYSGPFATNK